MGLHKCKNAMILFPAFCNNNNKPISSLSHLLHWKKNSKNNNKKPQLYISQIKLWNNWYLKHLGSNLWQWYKCNQVNGLKKFLLQFFLFWGRLEFANIMNILQKVKPLCAARGKRVFKIHTSWKWEY